MVRIICFLLFISSASTVLTAEPAESSETSPEPFPLDSSRELIDYWLRFHEEELCLEIDAVYVPDEGGMQVWSLVEDGKSYREFLRLLQPLSQSMRLEVFAAEAVRPANPFINGAPASLWENDELRKFYQAPRGRYDPKIQYDGPLGVVQQREIFVQRMIIFSRETLERGEKLERFAKDLPVLTRIATDPAFDADLRSLAYKVSLEHARGLEDQIDKLNKNLKQAITRSREEKELPLQDLPGIRSEVSPVELAERISGEAQSIARQVYEFIYPDSHTVALDELRNPSLLDTLNFLQELDAIYMQRMSRDIARF